jgi:hypothetical protein
LKSIEIVALKIVFNVKRDSGFASFFGVRPKSKPFLEIVALGEDSRDLL